MFEFLSAGKTSKGTAVQALVARLSARRRMPVVVYFGRDATDESVFASLGKNHLGVFAGRPRRNRARLLARSPKQVRRFLEQIGRIVP